MKWIALLGLLASTALVTGCEDDDAPLDEQVQDNANEAYENMEEAGDELGDNMQEAADETGDELEEVGDRIQASTE